MQIVQTSQFPVVRIQTRTLAQTAAVASAATFTVGPNDGSFLVSVNVLITVATSFSFSATVAFTDEGGTARTTNLTVTRSDTGAAATAMANAAGAISYYGFPVQIRAKASTAITLATSGTFTTVTYNVEGTITQLA